MLSLVPLTWAISQAYNALQRAPDVLACLPDKVVVWVGGNDHAEIALCSLAPIGEDPGSSDPTAAVA